VPGTPGTGALLNWQPDWKSQIIDRLLSERPGVFLDIGANIGQTLLDHAASRHAGGYIAFEPQLKCVEHLKDMIDINQIPDYLVVPAALAAENRPLTFYSVDEVDQGGSLLNDVEPVKSQRQYATIVPAYKLDDIIDGLLAGRPLGVIKIDVEGAEHIVLQGMLETLTKHRPTIICEVLHRDSNADPATHAERNRLLLNHLQAAGYKIDRIDKSADLQSVAGLTPFDRFPEKVFTRENAHECDYLFSPQEA
jgi:FkbM family methyltransferase